MFALNRTRSLPLDLAISLISSLGLISGEDSDELVGLVVNETHAARGRNLFVVHQVLGLQQLGQFDYVLLGKA